MCYKVPIQNIHLEMTKVQYKRFSPFGVNLHLLFVILYMRKIGHLVRYILSVITILPVIKQFCWVKCLNELLMQIFHSKKTVPVHHKTERTSRV